MGVEISEERKVILRAMAGDCDLQKLKDEIAVHRGNIGNFRVAIQQEFVTIAEYEYMIAVREARS